MSVYASLQPTVRLIHAQTEIARNLVFGASDAIPRALEYTGYACASDFWEDFLSEPIEAEGFVHFISTFHIRPPHLDPEPSNLQAVRMVLESLLKVVKRLKHPFILTTEDRAGKALIDPRGAVRWLLSMQRRRSLIPVELARHVEGAKQGAREPLSETEADELKRPGAVAPSNRNVPPLDLSKFLEKRATLQHTKPQLLQLAKQEFLGRNVTKRRFQEAYSALPSNQRRERGDTEKKLNARGDNNPP